VQPQGVKHHPHSPKSFEAAPFARADLTAVDTTAADYLHEGFIPASMESHGGEDVPIYARGPGSEAVHGTMDQNRIFHIMKQAFGW
jgi:alkaline phosphatase